MEIGLGVAGQALRRVRRVRFLICGVPPSAARMLQTDAMWTISSMTMPRSRL